MLAERRPELWPWLAWAVFAYALGLRVQLLGLNPLHMDEALYAGFSRRILHGDLLLTGGLNNDKPPLQFYLGSLSMLLFGQSEPALRLLNAAASAATCGLVTYWLLPLAGGAGAVLGGVLLATAPLDANFGAAVLMDGPLALLLFVSFVMAARGKAEFAGLAWGLACAAKQTAFFALPLPLLALALSPPRTGRWTGWSVGAAAALLPLFV